jgi:hypothetical protein
MVQALLRLAYMAAADMVLFAAGVPLQRYALYVALHDAGNTRLILLLLVVNVVLLGVIATAVFAGLDGVRRIIGCRKPEVSRAQPH